MMKLKWPVIALVLSILLVGLGGFGVIVTHADGLSKPCGYSKVDSGSTLPDVLHVTRSQNTFWEISLVDHCVRDATAVQHLYGEAKKQPLATGLYSCPSGRPIVYKLDFVKGDALIQHMELEVSGCVFLHIADEPTARYPSPDFIALFSEIVGISNIRQ